MSPSLLQQARDLAESWVISNPRSRRLVDVTLGTCGLVLARWLAWDGGYRVNMVGVLLNLQASADGALPTNLNSSS
jgi:hypothetical protein